MKEYTKIRRFYAWVGFAFIWAVILLVVLFFFAQYEFRNAKVIQRDIIAAVVTAYSSSVDETDKTPNINAAGARPKLGSIACPSKYPFGTVIVIQGKEYRCDDRMAQKLQKESHFDVWLPSKAEAIRFGRQLAIITIIK